VSRRVKGGTGRRKPKKRVTTSPEVAAPSDGFLVWRFGRLDHDGAFGCNTLAADDVKGLETELVAFQMQPIYALRAKKWLKFVPIGDMTLDGRKRLSQISDDQEDGLWQLHLGRWKWRVWGYFEDPEFFFLWWDSRHTVATGKSRNRQS
jgi:hypothetical protein